MAGGCSCVRSGVVQVSSACLGLVLATMSVPASAERDTATPADGWIEYESKVPAGTPTFVVQGRRLAGGGCALSGGGVLQPGQAAVETHELAFNPSTCESEMAHLILSPADLRAREVAEAQQQGPSESTSESSGWVPAQRLTPGPVSGQPSLLAARSGYSRTYYEDPPGLDVTSVQNSTDGLTV